jgi:hypothetical protein
MADPNRFRPFEERFLEYMQELNGVKQENKVKKNKPVERNLGYSQEHVQNFIKKHPNLAPRSSTVQVTPRLPEG